jgi:PAS domain S-box-containing protein
VEATGSFPASCTPALLSTDLRGTITQCNSAARELLRSAGDAGIIGRTLQHLFPACLPGREPATPELSDIQEELIRTGNSSGILQLRTGAGVEIPVRFQASLMSDGAATPSGYLWILGDPGPCELDSPKSPSHEVLQATLEAMPHPVFLKDNNGRYLACNQAFVRLVGRPTEHIVGSLPDSFTCESKECLAVLNDLDTSAQQARLITLTGSDGARRTLCFTQAPLNSRNGAAAGSVGVVLDLTEQTRVNEEFQLQATMLEEEIAKHQQVEEALREREKMLSLVINAVPQNIFWKDTRLVYAGCNESFARSAGLASPAEVVGKTDYDLPWGALQAEVFQRDDREVMRRQRAQFHSRETLQQADGTTRVLDTTKIPLLADDDCVVGLLGVYEDITQRTKVERELKESEERLSVIFEASQVGIILVNPNGCISFANRRMAEMLGISPEELLGTRYVSWLHPDQREQGDHSAQRLIKGEIGSVTVERNYQRRDGSEFWGYLSGRRLENSDGSLRALVGCIADITEHKASQRALEREKERLAVTLRSIGDGVITVNTEGQVVLINRVAEELCGYRQDEAAGLPLDQVFQVIDEKTRISKDNAVAQVLETGELIEQSGHGLLVARDGSERSIAAKTAPIIDREQRTLGVVLVFSDITERRAIQEELFKARKLESLGILAGGIAHDFNNLMTGIMGNIALSRAHLDDRHPGALFLERARKGAEQSKALTQQLLTFSKGGAPVKKLTSISQVLTDTAIFALRGSNVRCDFDIQPDLWSAEIDTGQMSQVISNLVINADQAMPAGGSILIRAENVLQLDETDRQRRIRITFKDTGHGISPEDLSRIYDPYFSTKATGNGLGLATVYAIIKNHDGDIRVFSRQGHGTTFAITLPATTEVPQEPVAPVENEPATAAGGGRILLMDDEGAIREMAAAALSMFGYEAVLACEGQEMLDLYRQGLEQGNRFDVVILDLTVPGGMGGKEAVQKLLEMDPQALALASSGYSDDPVIARFRDYGFAGVVSKPYSLKDLENALKQLIGQTRG